MDSERPPPSTQILPDQRAKSKMHLRNRHTNCDLKALCHERRLPAKGPKRTLIGRRHKDDRKKEQTIRQNKLRAFMEAKFRRAGSEGIESKGQTLSAEKLDSKEHARARSLTELPSILGAKLRDIGLTGNRFAKLADMATEDGNEMEINQGGEVSMNGCSESIHETAALKQDALSQVNQQEPHTVPRDDRDIDDLIEQMGNMSSPMLFYCSATGQAMSLDFTQPVRAHAGALTEENSEEEV